MHKIHLKKSIELIPFAVAAMLLIACSIAKADIVSLDSAFVVGQTDVVGKLNSDRTKLTNGVNNIQGVETGSVQTAGQIKAATVGDENMASSASPRVYLNELFIQNMDDNNGLVANGLEFQTSGSLATTATPGVAYTNGYRIDKSSAVPHTFTASKWTYSFVCQDGSMDYLERNIGVDITTGEYPANCQPLSRVSTDSTQVLAVADRRKLKFTYESFDSVWDDSLESSLKDLLVANGNSYRFGGLLQYTDASSYTVTAGGAMINGEARDRASFTSDPAWPVSSTSAQDGLDAGSYAAGQYYVYLVADENQVHTYRVVHSVNANTPVGKTNYMKIGEFYTNGGVISKDSVIPYVNGYNVGNGLRNVKGWVEFYGIGTATIRSSYNVSGVTRSATGEYTITWDTDFATANYSIVCSSTGNRQVCGTASLAAGTANIITGTGDSVNQNDPTGTGLVTAIAFGAQ